MGENAENTSDPENAQLKEIHAVGEVTTQEDPFINSEVERLEKELEQLKKLRDGNRSGQTGTAKDKEKSIKVESVKPPASYTYLIDDKPQFRNKFPKLTLASEDLDNRILGFVERSRSLMKNYNEDSIYSALELALPYQKIRDLSKKNNI